MDATSTIEGERVIDACRMARSDLWRVRPRYSHPANKAVLRRPIKQAQGPHIAAGASQG